MKTLVTTIVLISALVSDLDAQQSGYPFHIEDKDTWGCTIGVASGRITKENRPMIWKSSEAGVYDRDQTRVVYGMGSYGYVGIFYGSDDFTFQGVNDQGLAILNSYASDLSFENTGPGLGNAGIITYALKECRDVAAFEHLLDSTNITGRRTRGNFAVIDAAGNAVMYEVNDFQYWKYDANDPANTSGFIVRANFAMNGVGTAGANDQTHGLGRYNRSNILLDQICQGDSLDYRCMVRYHMRDVATDKTALTIPFEYSMYYPSVPRWYMFTWGSIMRSFTLAGNVIEGVAPGEPPEMTTMWAALGFPGTSIALPFWPVCDPPAVTTGEVGSAISKRIWQLHGTVFKDYYNISPYVGYAVAFLNTWALRDTLGTGLWPHLFRVEDSVFTFAETNLAAWRSGGWSPAEVQSAQDEIAAYVYDKLMTATATTSAPKTVGQDIPAVFALEQNFPNPFNPATNIGYRIEDRGNVKVSVFDMLGREVAVLVNEELSPGTHYTTWDATGMASGMYYYRLEATGEKGARWVETKKMMLVR